MKRNHAWNARVVRPRELSAAEVERWTSFCHADPSLGHPFFSYAFARAVDRARAHVFVAVLEREGRVVGFLPFQFAGRLARVLGAAERIGGNMADRFGVIAGEPLDLTPPELLRLAGLSSLNYSFMPVEQLSHGFPVQRTATGQRVVLAGDAAAFWPQLKKASRKFTTQLERKERVLVRDLGPLRVMLRADAAAELPRLIAVKRAQYKRTGRTDNFMSPWTTELFQELLATPDPECTAVLSTLYAGNTWLSSHLGIMSHSVFHHWFPVYNVDWHRCSPGHILTKELIVAALSWGVMFFDFGGFGHYKDYFRPETYEYQAGFWRRGGVAGALNGLVQSLSWRIEAMQNLYSERRRVAVANAGGNAVAEDADRETTAV